MYAGNGDECGAPFMNTRISDVLNFPELSFEIVNSMAPNAWRTASATQSEYSVEIFDASDLTCASNASARATALE